MRSEDYNKINAVLTDEDYDIIANYIPLAIRTMNPALSFSEKAENIALGLVGECGELSEIYKKHWFHGKPLNREDVIKEVGDVFWYIANAMYLINGPCAERVRRELLIGPHKNKPVASNWRALKRVYAQANLEESEDHYANRTPFTEIAFGCVCLGRLIMSPYLNTFYFARTRNSVRLAELLLLLKSVLLSVDCSLQDCLQKNVDKLKTRYPDGFSELDSQLRRDVKP